MTINKLIAYPSLIAGAAALAALCGPAASAQGVLFASFNGGAGGTPPTGVGGVSGVNNFLGNADWSADTFTMATSFTDPTITFWTYAVPVGSPAKISQQTDVYVQIFSGSTLPTRNVKLGTGANSGYTYAPASDEYPITSILDPALTYSGEGATTQAYEDTFVYDGTLSAGNHVLMLTNILPAADDYYWATDASGSAWSGIGGVPGGDANVFEITTPEPASSTAILIGLAGVAVLLICRKRRSSVTV